MRSILRPRLLLSLGAALVVTSGVVAAGAVLRDQKEKEPARVEAGPATTTEPSTTTSTLPPTTTTTAPAVPDLVQPPPANLPALPPEGLGPGASGIVVQAYEQRMADVKFDPGPIDGVWDQAMSYAVQAEQQFRGAQVTGRLTGNDQFALSYFTYPAPLVQPGPYTPMPEQNRTEVDITRGVLTLYENYQVRLISTVSTGSGENYCYNTPKDHPTEHICEDANTPSGRYSYYFFYDGWHKSVLGSLYNPFYFNKGIAVHGYEEVPPRPASHGCVRIPMHIAEYFHTLVNQGDIIYVFGGKPANITERTPLGGRSSTATTAPAIPPPGEPGSAPPSP